MAEQDKKNGKRDEDNPEFKNFQQLLKQVVSVPKEKIDKRRAEYERKEKQAGSGDASG